MINPISDLNVSSCEKGEFAEQSLPSGEGLGVVVSVLKFNIEFYLSEHVRSDEFRQYHSREF
jgi:hypothetical protein